MLIFVIPFKIKMGQATLIYDSLDVLTVFVARMAC